MPSRSDRGSRRALRQPSSGLSGGAQGRWRRHVVFDGSHCQQHQVGDSTSLSHGHRVGRRGGHFLDIYGRSRGHSSNVARDGLGTSRDPLPWCAVGPDGARTIVAIGSEPRLAAAVREHVPREVAVVRWATWARLHEVWARAVPWPWMVVGTGEVRAELAERCREAAVVVVWIGAAPPLLPPGGILLPGWPALAARLDRLRTVRAGGLRLSPYRGVLIPDGSRRLAPIAEALLAAHPWGVSETAQVRRGMGRLRRWGVPYHTRRDGELLRLAIGPRRKTPDREGGNR